MCGDDAPWAACAAKRRIYSPHDKVRSQTDGKALCWSERVRRQGLEPRTRGLRVGRPAAPGVLPAQMPQANARKAHIAPRYDSCPSHESSHGIRVDPNSVHHDE